MKHSPVPVAFPFSSSCGGDTQSKRSFLCVTERETTGGRTSAHITPSPGLTDTSWPCCLTDLQCDWLFTESPTVPKKKKSHWLSHIMSPPELPACLSSCLSVCISSFLTWTHEGLPHSAATRWPLPRSRMFPSCLQEPEVCGLGALMCHVGLYRCV